jgi:hypothetical protein
MHRLLVTLVLLAMVVGRPIPAGAHRLDEYLQATRLSVDLDQVTLEIDLTPGVNIATQVLAWIDTNRDGQVSPAEGDAYAQQMLSAVALSVDGNAVLVTLVSTQIPDLHDMRLGVGPIRLRATATMPPAGSGRHQLSYFNDHHPDMSAYLVNAFVPKDSRIQIATQRRDSAQHRLTLEFDLTLHSRSTRAWWLLAGLAAVGLPVVARRSVSRPR